MKIHDLLLAALADPCASERRDDKWMLATMANVLFALGKDNEAALYEERFRSLQRPSDWEVDTFEDGKKYAVKLTGRMSPVSAQHVE